MISRVVAVRGIRTLSSNAVMKPPNIGIFQGTKSGVDDQMPVRTALSKCLNVDRYAFVGIDESAVRRRDKWADNVILVVIGGRSAGIDADTLNAFRERWLRGGKFLDTSVSLDFVVGLLNPSWNRTTTKSSSVRIENCPLPTDLINETLLCIRQEDCSGMTSSVATDDGIVVVGTITAPQTDGVVLFSQARLELDNTTESSSSSSALTFWQDLLTRHLDLDCCQTTESSSSSSSNHVTPCYLISSSEMRSKSFLESIGPHLLDGTELECSKLTLKNDDDNVDVPEHRIPLLMDSAVPGFNQEAYFRHLKSRQLGQVVIFGRILPSTMDLISSSVAPHGLVIIAGRQTTGRGRSDHCWLSPEGCAMFSVHIRLSLRSAIGQRPSFVQHLAAMAAVQGIRTLPGYENLDVRLKWPNDIYYGSSVKIGGTFVQSSVTADELCCVIGVGLNISNGHPTMCINDIIRVSSASPSLAELLPEVSIARTLSRLETLLDTFESEDGVRNILRQYYDLWIHENAEVKLSRAESEVPIEDGIIRGLDDDGFLVVQLKDDRNSLYSVQPDGNSFDVLHNMVIIRRQTSTSFHGPRT